MQPWLVRTDSSTGLDWTLCAWRPLEHKFIAISMSFWDPTLNPAPGQLATDLTPLLRFVAMQNWSHISQHLNISHVSLKCQVCSRLETSDFVMLSFISNVKCFEFDVTGSPAHLLTFRCCHLMHFPTIWWWKHVKWVSSSVHREHVVWCTKPLCECPGCHWQGALALLQVPWRIHKQNLYECFW